MVPACVAGGGRDRAHFLKSAAEVEANGPLIVADYGFLSDRAETRVESESRGLTPIMVMRDRGSGSTLSLLCCCRNYNSHIMIYNPCYNQCNTGYTFRMST